MAGRIRHYVKSALKQAKADPLFTAIYIAGVTLAIATTLTMAMLYYIKAAPIYPEVNRGKTYYIDTVKMKNEILTFQSRPSLYFIDNYLKNIDGVEDVCGYRESFDDASVQISEDRGDIPAKTKSVDDGFFRVFRFNFLQGFPFTREDIEGRVKEVIITDELAELVFGKSETDIVGKMLSVDFEEYRVKGVVESASPLTNVSFAQIYFPGVEEKAAPNVIGGGAPPAPSEADRVMGGVVCVLLIDDANVEAVSAELQEQMRKIERMSKDSPKGDVTLELSPLESHVKSVFAGDTDAETWWEALKGNLIVLLVVLLVPAMNLGGLITGRMDARVGELGLRKAFGASRRSIYSQVLSENLVYTLMGGVFGLIAAAMIVVTGRMALMKLIDSSYNTILVETASVTYRPEMFFSWTIFGVALAVCLVLNIASAMIPAWVSMRRTIVDSLNEKR